MELRNFIAGEFTPALSGSTLENRNPATGLVQGHLPASDARDVEAAVAAARAAFPVWRDRARTARAEALRAIADGIERRKREFALAESRDQGKPVSLALSMDVPRAVENFRFFAGAILHEEDTCLHGEGPLLSYVSRAPLGVAGLVTPWNLPLYLLTWKIAPALATGNTVVCKPSEFTSTTAQMLCEVMLEAGLPRGVCNVVMGTGPAAGEPLVTHRQVPLVSFTGGTATGARIAMATASSFKKLSLELGGKNANVVFADADLDAAVKTSVRAAFLNQGEICLCGSRLYVERPLYDTFLARFLAETSRLVVGDPEDARTTTGALVSAAHRDKVESYVAMARDEGARIAAGGARPRLPAPFANGYFLEPTVITDLPRDSRLLREEIFGPVVTLLPFDTEAEVIEEANAVEYGLSASIWTSDLSRAHRVAHALDAGTVWVNAWLARDLRAPFGGMKASGIGREGGRHSLEFYTESKTIAVKWDRGPRGT